MNAMTVVLTKEAFSRHVCLALSGVRHCGVRLPPLFGLSAGLYHVFPARSFLALVDGIR
jgi:hypothetical protein